ncbi:hypothetical protein SRHO_G00280070 [Serrasalmus rhombeus]
MYAFARLEPEAKSETKAFCCKTVAAKKMPMIRYMASALILVRTAKRLRPLPCHSGLTHTVVIRIVVDTEDGTTRHDLLIILLPCAQVSGSLCLHTRLSVMWNDWHGHLGRTLKDKKSEIL